MSIFNELIECSSHRKELETYIAKMKENFELSLAKELVDLQETKLKEAVIKEEVMALLKKNNETSVVADNHSITKSVKTTLQIDDAGALLIAIGKNDTAVEECGIENAKVFLENTFEQKVLVKVDAKKDLLNLIEKFKNIEGSLLDGVKEQITEFLTIKNVK
jgi:hypothetical protein